MLAFSILYWPFIQENL